MSKAKNVAEEPEIPNIEKRNFSQSLKCKLTEDEIVDSRKMRSDEMQRRLALEPVQ